jgi:hypothetical protein
LRVLVVHESLRGSANRSNLRPEGEGSDGDVDDYEAWDDASLRTELRLKKCGENEAGRVADGIVPNPLGSEPTTLYITFC